jgi:hypothetical protein
MIGPANTYHYIGLPSVRISGRGSTRARGLTLLGMQLLGCNFWEQLPG